MANAPEDNHSNLQPYVRAVYVPSRSAPNLCSCVSFAKWYLYRENEIWGNAGDIKPTSFEPKIDRVVLLREGEWGHTGVVIGITETEVSIIESNYIPCRISERTILIDSPLIRGYKD